MWRCTHCLLKRRIRKQGNGGFMIRIALQLLIVVFIEQWLNENSNCCVFISWKTCSLITFFIKIHIVFLPLIKLWSCCFSYLLTVWRHPLSGTNIVPVATHILYLPLSEKSGVNADISMDPSERVHITHLLLHRVWKKRYVLGLRPIRFWSPLVSDKYYLVNEKMQFTNNYFIY